NEKKKQYSSSLSKNEWLIHSLSIKDQAPLPDCRQNMSMLTTTCTVLGLNWRTMIKIKRKGI
ncbi:hypothetical protein BpHYR1_019702, partial [Brachionus plicatilis]